MGNQANRKFNKIGRKEESWTLLWASCQNWSNNSAPRQVGLKEEDLGCLALMRGRRNGSFWDTHE